MFTPYRFNFVATTVLFSTLLSNFLFRLNSGMVYYTFSWVFADIGGNMYVNFFLSAIVEAPMHLIAIIAMQK